MTLYHPIQYICYSYSSFYQSVNKYYIQLMGLKQFFKNFILRADLFAAPATLRYGNEPVYQTICGGVLSTLLMIFFVAIFATSFLNVLSKVDIQATIETDLDPFHLNNINDSYFAIEIQGIDFRQNLKYFTVALEQITITDLTVQTETPLELKLCDRNDWTAISSNFGEIYDDYQMSKMLCPVSTNAMILSGFFNSQTWKKLEVHVKECANTTTWTCHPTATINTFLNSYLATNGLFKLKFHWSSVIIKAHKEQFLAKVIDNRAFFPFTTTIASWGQVLLSKYKVQTDESIWPIAQTTTSQGHFYEDYHQTTVNKILPQFSVVQIVLSNRLFLVQRSHGKLDNMLSYAGGLFSLLFVFLFFFLGAYSEYGYQLYIAENLFVQQAGEPHEPEKKFNFLVYLKYALYDWIKAFQVNLHWKQMEDLDEMRIQATEQMDLRYLLKRIQNLQKVNEILLKEHQLVSVYLSEPLTLKKVKKLRKLTEFYGKKLNSSEGGGSKVHNEEEIYFSQSDQEVQQAVVSSMKQIMIDDDNTSKQIASNISNEMKRNLSEKQLLGVQRL